MATGFFPGYESNEQLRIWYEYDAWNRLAAVGLVAEIPPNSDDPKPAHGRYRYDGLNRRVCALESAGFDIWAKKHYYYNENWQVLDEWVDWTDDSEAPSSPGWYASYVWDLRYIDSPITRKMANPEHQVYYLSDANFNVTAVIDTRIAQADVSERYVYDPYGQVKVLHGARDINHTDTSEDEWWPRTSNDYRTDVLFAGYRYDRGLNLYHVRHRVYHPTLGRWMQRDPAEYVDGMSLYEYVRSTPIASCDPYGLEQVVLYRQLTWEDFQAEWADAFDTHMARIKTGWIHDAPVYVTSCGSERNGCWCEVCVIDVTVRAVMMPAESAKRPNIERHPDADGWLAHEQGHFDIALAAGQVFWLRLVTSCGRGLGDSLPEAKANALEDWREVYRAIVDAVLAEQAQADHAWDTPPIGGFR